MSLLLHSGSRGVVDASVEGEELTHSNDWWTDRDEVLGRVVHYTALIVPSALIIYSLLFSVGNTKPFGLYDHIPLGMFGIHRLTTILLCFSFLFHYSLMSYLFPLARSIIALTLVMFCVYLGGITWTVNSYLVRGHGNLPFLIVGFTIVCILLERFDNKHGMLNPSKWALVIVFILAVLQFIGYVGMWKTGFWEILELEDLGFPAGDANQNIFWAFMKITGLWYSLPFIDRQKMKAPLRLDPRILVW